MAKLDHAEVSQIQMLAEGLSPTEVCAYMGWEAESLLGDEPEDPEFTASFKRAFNQGRARLKLHAVQKLKESMSGKEGMRASLAVLTRFAEEWPSEVGNDDGLAGVQRAFRIVLD